MDAIAVTARPRPAALLDRVFDTYFRHPLPLLLLAALYAAAYVPMQALADATEPSGAAFLRQLVLMLVANLAWGASAFAVTRIVRADLHGEPAGVARVFGDTARALPGVIGIVLLYLLVFFGRMLLLIIPGVVFGIAAVFAVNVAAGGSLSGWSAIRRSRDLTRRRWWRTLGWLTLFNLPCVLLVAFFEYLPKDASFVAMQAALFALLTPIALIGQTLLYFDLEARRDAAEREAARRILEAAPSAPAPAPVYAAPSHATFDASAFSAFEHRGWQSAAAAYQRAFVALTSQAADSLLDAAGVEGGTRLLDVASGPGHLAMLAAARGAQVTGSDFAPEMLALARANHPGIEFRVADAEALPFPDRSFDAVTTSFVLGHLAHPDRALTEARRVLRAGGKVAVSWWQPFDRTVAFGIVLDAVQTFGRAQVDLPEGPPFNQYSDPDVLARALAEAGFGDVRLSPEPMTWRMGSGEEVFDAYLHGTVRTAGLLREQSPEALLAIRAEVVRRVEALRTADGIALPMPCWIASGVRAG